MHNCKLIFLLILSRILYTSTSFGADVPELCHSDTINIPCTPPSANFITVSYAIKVNSDYAGALLYVSSTKVMVQCTTKVYGTFPTPSIVGGPCQTIINNITTSISIFAPLGTCNYIEGYYIISLEITWNPADCDQKIIVSNGVTPGICDDMSAPPCEDCLPSFAPEPGKAYIISCWVKEASAPVTTITYSNPTIKIKYTGSTYVRGPLLAKGQIIDGWQLLEDSFKIPLTATKISFLLEPVSGGSVYYDDFRVFPYDGSMKTYVYNPLTLRLEAELDERHYATIYEYDEEGRLIRVKKETERGIMTIQENKTNTSKK